MNRDKVINLAKKVKALADRGKDGEKLVAKERLKKICEKYNISEEELIILEELNDFYFIIHDPYEKDLLKNVICMVLNVKGFRWKERNNCIKILMTSSNYSDVCQAFQHYKSTYDSYKKHLVDAIIIKNEIYCTRNESKPPVDSNMDVENKEEEKKENKPPKESIPISDKLIKIANIVEKNVWIKKRNSLTE